MQKVAKLDIMKNLRSKVLRAHKLALIRIVCLHLLNSSNVHMDQCMSVIHVDKTHVNTDPPNRPSHTTAAVHHSFLRLNIEHIRNSQHYLCSIISATFRKNYTAPSIHLNVRTTEHIKLYWNKKIKLSKTCVI